MLFQALFSSSEHFQQCHDFGRTNWHFIGPLFPGRPRRHTVHAYSIEAQSYEVAAMIEGHSEKLVGQTQAIARRYALLRDEVALLKMPGAHHKALLAQAHALHREQLIDRDDLSDLLEQADSALAYAVEALIDCRSSDQAG
ncbi:hypothetical protein [Pseudomonas hormoni]